MYICLACYGNCQKHSEHDGIMDENLILLIAYGTVGLYSIATIGDKILSWLDRKAAPAIERVKSKTRVFVKQSAFFLFAGALAFSVIYILNGGFEVF